MSRMDLPADQSRVVREFLTAVVLHGQAVAEAMGMHPTDAYALNLLAVVGPVTVGELGERTGLSTGAATRLVDRLEAAGAVSRTRSPTDRRRVVIEALPADQRRDERAERLLRPVRAAVAEVFDSYDAGQLALLLEFLTRTTIALREAALAAPGPVPGHPGDPQDQCSTGS